MFDLALTPDRADGQGCECLALSFANLLRETIREGVALLGARL